MVRGENIQKPTWTLKLWLFPVVESGGLLVCWNGGVKWLPPPRWWVLARSLGDKLLLAQVLCLVAKSSENAVTVGEEALSMYQSMGMKDKVRLGSLGVGSMSWGSLGETCTHTKSLNALTGIGCFWKGEVFSTVWKEKYGLGMSQSYVRRTWLIFLVTDFLGILLGSPGETSPWSCVFTKHCSDDFTCQRGAFHVV